MLAPPSGTRAAWHDMATLLWLGLLVGYAWSVWTLRRQMRHDPSRVTLGERPEAAPLRSTHPGHATAMRHPS
jgi:hypothetical protein